MRRRWRMWTVVLAIAGLTAAAQSAVADRGHSGHPGAGKAADRLFTLQPNPAGNPEGIAYDLRSKAFYVSITGDGAIYRGTLGSATVAPYIAGGVGRAAIGIKVWRGRLYIAGGPTGTITVLDLATKQPVATFDTGTGGFLNDLVVTGHGDVYVTDSFRPVLWHVTAEQVRSGGGTPQALGVSQSVSYGSGFNLNGIVSRGSHRLVVVQTNTGKLFRIDLAARGDAIRRTFEVAGANVPGGDGMLLDRGRLVVVQGGPPAQLSFLELRHADRRARVRETRTSDKLNGPSTIARAKKLYLVVNADFAHNATPFTVAGLPRILAPR